MKKQNLLSILAIPIITILNLFNLGCVYSDQIRIPNHIPYKYNIGGKEIKAYYNMFINLHTGSHILEVRQKDGSKINYIGSGPISGEPILDFLEKGIGGLNRASIGSLPKEEQGQRKKEYKQYIERLMEILKE